MPGQLSTPPHSEENARGKAYLRAHALKDVPMLHRLFRSLQSSVVSCMILTVSEAERDVTTPTQLESSLMSSPGQHFGEHSNWGSVAEEDVEAALQRLAMLARDDHKDDGSKSVEQHYSERLTVLLKKAEIEYDASTLK